MKRVINNIRNHRNWFAYYAYKYFTDRKKDFTFKSRGGIKITVPRRMQHTYKECFFDQTYFKGLPAAVLQQPFHTIIDVGANVGYFSLFMFAHYPKAKIIAFEPMPVNFKLLQQYKNENPALDFTIINKAVSEPGQKVISLNYDSQDSFTTAASIFDNHPSNEKLEVATISLQDILAENNIDHIDFLKLDCEGSEYPILYTASDEVLNKIFVMALETHPGRAANENKPALMVFLKGKGFEINSQNDIIWAWKNK